MAQLEGADALSDSEIGKMKIETFRNKHDLSYDVDLKKERTAYSFLVTYNFGDDIPLPTQWTETDPKSTFR